MTPAEAKVLLSYHSGRNEDTTHEKWISGFLGSLRPYIGTPDEGNFHEVISCLRTLMPEINNADTIDRHLTGDILGIVHLGRLWAVAPDGMLRRNGLIADLDWQLIEQWIDIIMYAFMMMLDGCGEKEVFAEYDSYLSTRGERS